MQHTPPSNAIQQSARSNCTAQQQHHQFIDLQSVLGALLAFAATEFRPLHLQDYIYEAAAALLCDTYVNALVVLTLLDFRLI
uniref:Uncharacterized protein n=1 Tax=Onchocerca volvulus TaxID=6282 RepID=A0A8R1XTQ4_ONCVO